MSSSKIILIQYEFEEWLKSEGISIERHPAFPYSYKMSDNDSSWAAWQAAHKKYSTRTGGD